MAAYYNEIDGFCAQWLRNLIDAELIAPGDVDERDIRDVKPSDLDGYTQCHFFAGIGAWSYALRLAGWSDGRPIWTGSCPCQSFSAAGARKGFADERHLWPAWHHLIRQRRPPVVLGEQVASKAALEWLDLVQDDMEGEGYAVGASDLCAASVGAPHIRQRLWFVAKSNSGQRRRRSVIEGVERHGKNARRSESGSGPASCGEDGGVAQPDVSRRVEWREAAEIARYGDNAGAADSSDRHRSAGPTDGFWRDADWLYCRDGKWRCVEPGTFPLVDGIAARMGRLRAYGNTIVAQQAKVFIEAALPEL